MKFNYQFSNLLGTVYRKGNLVFTPDGNCVISPVGNKISIYDLKNHKSSTLPIESRFNFTSLALSPNGILLLAVNEDGEINLISLISKSVLHKLRTNREIHCMAFSPDSRRFAITKENIVQVFRSPGPHNREYNAFALDRVFRGAFDDTVSLSWTSCSRVLAVGAKDNTTRMYALEKFSNFTAYCLGGHSEPIVATFFEKDSLVCYTVSQDGHLVVWESSLNLDELEISTAETQKVIKKNKNQSEKSDSEEETEGKEDVNDDKTLIADDKTSLGSKLFYKRQARHFLRDAMPKEKQRKDKKSENEEAGERYIAPRVTAADFNHSNHILVTGFSNGVFFIHEMPEAQLIHSLCISDQSILSVALNPSGDWIAFGCEHLGQLLVWEWQSETYVLKQQGHFNNLTCVNYSPDGSTIATGGEDGKVKLWNIISGFCYVTFSEHSSSVSSVVHTPNGKVVLSASLDGTVRAFDLTRYRNFRTFTSPRPAQFGCLSVDSSGELIAAGGVDVYEIFLWSLQTGRLLEVISAHEGPVSSLAFSPGVASSQLATVSWDKTLRLWDALAVGTNNEAIELVSDATAVIFRPDGVQVAVATLNGHIVFFDSRSNVQTGSIEGRNDLYVGRTDTDLITAKKSKEGKGYFSTLAYTSDGSCILAGGHSKVICIYHVEEALLIKKFELTQNRSFDGMDDIISRKKMSEFGNLALVEDRDDSAGSTTLKLPGTRKGDLSSRSFKPEVKVSGLQFSPTGRDFVATSTEGLLVYSLDSRMFFDPFELEINITPDSIRKVLKLESDFGKAMLMALKLNENDLLREVIEQIPVDEISLIVSNMPEEYVLKLLKFVGIELETTKHLHFYASWIRQILTHHGLWLKTKSKNHMPTLNLLHRNLALKSGKLVELCERNTHTMEFLILMAKLKKDNPTEDDQMDALESKWSDDEM